MRGLSSNRQGSKKTPHCSRCYILMSCCRKCSVTLTGSGSFHCPLVFDLFACLYIMSHQLSHELLYRSDVPCSHSVSPSVVSVPRPSPAVPQRTHPSLAADCDSGCDAMLCLVFDSLLTDFSVLCRMGGARGLPLAPGCRIPAVRPDV